MEETVNKHILVKYINGELADESEKRRVIEWINANKQNQEYFKALYAIYRAAERSEEEIKELKDRIWATLERKASKSVTYSKINSTFNWKKTLAVAASIAIIVSLSIFFVFYQGDAASNYYTFSADAGSKSKITLIDGTIVYLNAETELRIPKDFGKNNRNVELRGEAYFDVQKTVNKSLFVVHVNKLNIKVLGTEFNVKGYPEEGTIETTLEKGKVVIEKQSQGKVNKIVTLEPNQQAIFIKKQGDIRISSLEKEASLESCLMDKDEKLTNNKERKEQLVLKEQIETKLYTSWREGKFVFESERFDHLIIRMERWYGINIKLDNDFLKGIEFSGTLINETVEQALEALKMTHHFHYSMDIKNNVIYIK